MKALVSEFTIQFLCPAIIVVMQARSGHSEPLFTPSQRIKNRGGFGHSGGTGCLEFRSLDRGADAVLMLGDIPFDEAVRNLEHRIASIRKESSESPIIPSGLADWVDEWHQNHDIDKSVANIIVAAMARYLLHLRSEGKSQRTLSGGHSDLQAAGMLVTMYDYPRGKRKRKYSIFFLIRLGR